MQTFHFKNKEKRLESQNLSCLRSLFGTCLVEVPATSKENITDRKADLIEVIILLTLLKIILDFIYEWHFQSI